MTMRPTNLIPVLAMLALGCPADDGTGTGTETGSTGNTESTGPGTTAPADTSTSAADTGSGTTAAVDTTVGSSTTGASLCGNGDLDDGEECDDGNDDDTDACRADCTATFTIVWEAIYNGPQSNNDGANDVLVDADGTAYVLGSERVMGEGANLWLRQYMPDGTEGWTYTFNGADSLDDAGASLTRNADGDFVIAGTTETAATGEDGLVLVVPADGTTETLIITFDGPGSGPGDNDDLDSADAVAVDPDGNIDVVGTIRIGAQDWDVFVAEYDATGTELWTSTYVGAGGGSDGAQDIHVADDGTVSVLAYEELDTGSQGLVLVYDTDGVAAVDPPQTFTDYFPRDWVYDADGRAVTGNTTDVGRGIVTTYDDTWTVGWTAQYSDNAMVYDVGYGVARAADGGAVMVGLSSHPPQSNNAYVAAYGPDGAVLWIDRFNDMDTNDAALNQSFDAVAIDGNGDVTVVGEVQRLGEQNNVFVRRYHPQ